jgi:hypothetical protein
MGFFKVRMASEYGKIGKSLGFGNPDPLKESCANPSKIAQVPNEGFALLVTLIWSISHNASDMSAAMSANHENHIYSLEYQIFIWTDMEWGSQLLQEYFTVHWELIAMPYLLVPCGFWVDYLSYSMIWNE